MRGGTIQKIRNYWGVYYRDGVEPIKVFFTLDEAEDCVREKCKQGQERAEDFEIKLYYYKNAWENWDRKTLI